MIDSDQDFYARDFHDDGEPGAGRILLDLLERHNIRQKVIFIARKYGGVKMGTDRFLCYLNAAKSCLNINEEDSTTVNNQRMRSARQQNPRFQSAGRGRGRGRSAGSYLGTRHHSQPRKPFEIAFTKNQLPSADSQMQQAKQPPVQMQMQLQQLQKLQQQFYPPLQQSIRNSVPIRGHHSQTASARQHHNHLHRFYGQNFQTPMTSSVKESSTSSAQVSRRNSITIVGEQDTADEGVMDFTFSNPTAVTDEEAKKWEEQWSQDHQGAWSMDNETEIKKIQ